jgi:lipid-A-disaccharide synthase
MAGAGGNREAPALDVFVVAGEASGDVLGAGLMRSLARQCSGAVAFRGVGGHRMADAGLASLYPMQDIMAIGVAPIIAKLPTILRRLRETVDAVVAAPPDVLILIDVPDFNQRVARRVRRRLPHVPIVTYVSPTDRAWRPGRAKAMRPSVDLILALLPFEPDVHRDLGGPPCEYVGHPLLAHLDSLRPSPDEAKARQTVPLVLALPGSRRQEVRRLGPIFGEALARVAEQHPDLEVVLPTVPHLIEQVAAVTVGWPVQPRMVTAEDDKHAAFRRARAALAASGTVTLELALAGVPQVAAYRIPAIEGLIMRAVVRPHPVVKVRSVILANLVLGETVVPEFLQSRCTPANLAVSLADILDDTPARRRQEQAFRRLDAILGIGGVPPSDRAARAVLDLLALR